MSRRTAPAPYHVLHPAVRCGLSLLFVVHLAGIFVAPMMSSIVTALGQLPPEVQPEEAPTPWLLELLQPYLDVAYLNHGYGFFSPDPGPSHLLRCTIEHADGRVEQLQVPDIQRHWPRLRYHRHFMLAEQVLPGSGPSYARHLLAEYGARRVTVDRVRHYLLRPDEVLAGTKLDAPSTYQSLGPVTIPPNGRDTAADVRERDRATNE